MLLCSVFPHPWAATGQNWCETQRGIICWYKICLLTVWPIMRFQILKISHFLDKNFSLQSEVMFHKFTEAMTHPYLKENCMVTFWPDIPLDCVLPCLANLLTNHTCTEKNLWYLSTYEKSKLNPKFSTLTTEMDHTSTSNFPRSKVI